MPITESSVAKKHVIGNSTIKQFLQQHIQQRIEESINDAIAARAPRIKQAIATLVGVSKLLKNYFHQEARLINFTKDLPCNLV